MYDVQIYTAQLLKIIQYSKFKGMYVHHAQDVLHAALACFRSTNSNHEYLTIIDLLSCIKEEMEPLELFKYVDIIIECLLEKQQRVGGEKAQNQFLLLFRYVSNPWYTLIWHYLFTTVLEYTERYTGVCQRRHHNEGNQHLHWHGKICDSALRRCTFI